MRTLRQLSPWVILGVALVIVTVWALIPKGALYGGKSLRYWCNEFESGSRRRAKVERAVRDMGSSGVPILLAILSHRESPLHAQLASIVHRMPRRLQDIFTLSRESDDLLHIRATLLLVQIGAPATSNELAVLRRALDDPSDPVRANAVVAVGKTSPQVPEAFLAVEALEYATRDKAVTVRANAYFNLAKFSARFPDVGPVLKAGFEDPDSYVRVSTTNGLVGASGDTHSTGANK